MANDSPAKSLVDIDLSSLRVSSGAGGGQRPGGPPRGPAGLGVGAEGSGAGVGLRGGAGPACGEPPWGVVEGFVGG